MICRIPEPTVPSSPVSVTDGLANQPLRTAGLSTAHDVGSFRSSLIVNECGDSTPPLSSVDQNDTVLLPSAEKENGAVYVCGGPPFTVYCVEATPKPPSLAVNVTSGDVVYQSVPCSYCALNW